MKKVRFDPIVRLILIPDDQKGELERERLALAALYQLSINQCHECNIQTLPRTRLTSNTHEE